MPPITSLIANYGDIIELAPQPFDLTLIKDKIFADQNWKRYNPRKAIKRFGLSVTSLDGGYSGTPDLDSLREYNRLYNTAYTENSFKTRTPIVSETGLAPFLDKWGDDLGRCHFLRLDSGGFFPPHRDNGISLPPKTIRILVPIHWHQDSAVWLQDGKRLNLQPGRAYFINTSKEHSVFSFTDWTTLLVLNIDATEEACYKVLENANIL